MDRFLFRGVKLATMDKSVKDSKNIVVLPVCETSAHRTAMVGQVVTVEASVPEDKTVLLRKMEKIGVIIKRSEGVAVSDSDRKAIRSIIKG